MQKAINNQSKKSSIVNKVLGRIKRGEVKMKPKAYFILKTVLALLAIVVVALFALYLISFIHFSLRASGTWYLCVPATMNGRAVWLAGTYNDRYRKVGGQWLFSQVKVNMAFMTPYETGWVKERVVSS